MKRIENKLILGERAIVDALLLQKNDRKKIASIGAEMHVPVFYIVVDKPLSEKLQKYTSPDDVALIEKQDQIFQSNQKDILKGDGTATVIDTRPNETVISEEIEVVEKFNFYDILNDIKSRDFNAVTAIGDVHGMTNDFIRHIQKAQDQKNLIIQLGDIVDYGPDSVGCVDLMYKLVMNGEAIFIIGNHERKLEKYILQRREGKVRIKIEGGITKTVEQLDKLGDTKRYIFEQKFLALMNYARHHLRIKDNLFVHASSTRNMWTQISNRLTGFDENRAVFGEVDQHAPRDENGFPHRLYNWVDEIPYGHTVYVGHAYLDLFNPVTKDGKSGGKAIFVDTGSGKEGTLSSVDIIL